MEERVYLIELYEYYGKLLTKKQQQYFEDYYYDNLTILEIAENELISKNAISNQIITIKDKLYYYEEILNLYKNKIEINKLIINLDDDLKEKINELI